MYDLRWRGEYVRLILHRWGELMVFIHFIFDTLCTLIHRCQYTSSLCFSMCSGFPGKTSIAFASLSHTRFPQDRQTERDYFQSCCSRVPTPEKIAYTSDLELDWAAPSWLSTGVKLQSPNKDYANWNMENNKQLGPPCTRWKHFQIRLLTSSRRCITIMGLGLWHSCV